MAFATRARRRQVLGLRLPCGRGECHSELIVGPPDHAAQPSCTTVLKRQMKVSGKPNVLASLRHAPPLVMFSTVQKMTGERRGTIIFALRATRVRFTALRSISLASLAAASTMTRPACRHARKNA